MTDTYRVIPWSNRQIRQFVGLCAEFPWPLSSACNNDWFVALAGIQRMNGPVHLGYGERR